jgi:hypothetical protein
VSTAASLVADPGRPWYRDEGVVALVCQANKKKVHRVMA